MVMSKPQRTYRTRIVRSRPIRTLALTVAAALLVAGCSKELPQTPAAENPKGLESQQASAGSGSSVPKPSPEPTYAVPEYSTAFDLNARETQEAEEALLVLQRYIFLSERMMRSGGTDQTDLDDVTLNDALTGLQTVGDQLAADEEKLFGQIEIDKYVISEFVLSDENTEEDSAVIVGCMLGDKWGIGPESGNKDSARMESEKRMLWALKKDPNDWKVSRQELEGESCA